jgi:ABC-type xylose transport system permease subunit
MTDSPITFFAGIYLAIAGIVGAIAIIEESPEKRKQRQEAGFMLSAISFTITNLLWPVVLIHAFLHFNSPGSDD